MTDERWVIRIGEDVALETPSGTLVQGLPHKALGLAALLALMTPEPVSRASAGSILWPQATPEQRQASLRQAIMALRKAAAGASFLDAGRTSLRLNLATVRVERESVSDLLCRFSEPWFALFRSSESAARQEALEGASEVREASAVRALENLLDWTIRHQVNQAYGLIRHSIDLATSLPPHRALALSKELLRRGAINHPLRGWANLLHAFALFFCLETEAASRAFQDLRAAALNQGDVELMVMAAFFEAGCVLPMGGLEHAESILRQAGSLRVRGIPPRATIRLAHGSGLAACCRGDYGRGLKLLSDAVESAGRAGEAYEQLYAAVNMAWIAASIDHGDSARTALCVFDQVDTGDHWRFQLTADLARLHLLCADGDAAAGLSLGEQALGQARRLDALGFETYFRESMARCHAALGDKARARQEVAAARRIRQRIQWAIVPWDADRLALARAS